MKTLHSARAARKRFVRTSRKPLGSKRVTSARPMPRMRDALAFARAITVAAIHARGWTPERLSGAVIVCDVSHARRPVVHLVAAEVAAASSVDALRQAAAEGSTRGRVPLVVLSPDGLTVGCVRYVPGGAS